MDHVDFYLTKKGMTMTKEQIRTILERMDMTQAELTEDGLVGSAKDVRDGMDAIVELAAQVQWARATHSS
jgi:hypothetical protein